MRGDFSHNQSFHRGDFSLVSREFCRSSRSESHVNKGFLKVAYLLPLYVCVDDSMRLEAVGFVAGFLTGLEFGLVVGTVLG